MKGYNNDELQSTADTGRYEQIRNRTYKQISRDSTDNTHACEDTYLYGKDSSFHAMDHPGQGQYIKKPLAVHGTAHLRNLLHILPWL
jgi:hypothetical protein